MSQLVCVGGKEHIPTATIVTVVLVAVIVVVIVALILIKRRKESNVLSTYDEVKIPEANDKGNILNPNTEARNDKINEVNDEGSYLYTTSTDTEAALPTYISLQKDSNLKEKSTTIAEQVENLEEFKSLVNYVKENVKKEMTIRNEERNKEHNRYIDIGKIS